MAARLTAAAHGRGLGAFPQTLALVIDPVAFPQTLAHAMAKII
jgi:hypothetical protein